MKKIIIFLTISLSACPFCAFAQSEPRERKLYFAQALEEMKGANEKLIIAQAEQKKTAYEKKSAFGLFFPKIDVMFTYTHLSDPIEMDFNPLKDAMIGMGAAAAGAAAGTTVSSSGISYDQQVAQAAQGVYMGQISQSSQLANKDNFIETIQDKNFWTVTATVQQPIFMGGKILAANKAAAAKHSLSSAKLKYAENYLTTELTERYFGYALALEVVKVREQVLTGMKHHNSDANSLYKNGIIAKAELMQSEVALAEAERELKKALRDADTTSAGLMNTLSTDDKIIPVSKLFFFTPQNDAAYYKARAMDYNPVLSQIAANRSLAHQSYRNEMSAMYPNVFLFGSVNLFNYQLTEHAPDWLVGLGATYTIFHGLTNYHSIKAASALEKEAETAEHKARRDIGTLVEKNYNALMKVVEEIESLDKSIEFAKEFVRVRETAFREGLASSADVVDARLNQSKVQIEKLKAMYEFDVSLARLLEACGLSSELTGYIDSGGK